VDTNNVERETLRREHVFPRQHKCFIYIEKTTYEIHNLYIPNY